MKIYKTLFECIGCKDNKKKTIMEWIDSNIGCEVCQGNMFQTIFKSIGIPNNGNPTSQDTISIENY